MKSFKKLLVLSFSTMLAFGLFACDDKKPSDSVTSESATSESTGGETSSTTTDSSATVEEKLGDVFADMLEATYGDKSSLTKTADFTLPTRPTTFNSEEVEVTAEITYEVSVVDGVAGAIALGEVDDKGAQHFTVKYNAEESVINSNVKVTANIKVSDSDTATYEFNFVVPAFKYTTFAEFKDAADAGSKEVVNVRGTVVAIYKSGLYVVDSTSSGFYAYGPDGFSADNYKIGDEVLVAGVPTKYNGQYEFSSKCGVTKLNDAPADFKPTYTDITSVFDAAVNASDAAFIPYQNSLVSVTGATIGTIDSANYYYYFTKNDIKYYARTSTSFNGLTSDQCTEMMKEWTEGYTATVRGLLSIYNGNYYITPLYDDAIEITDKTLSDEAKASADVNTMMGSVKAAYVANQELTFPTEGANKSALTYEVTAGDNTKLNGNVFSVVPGAEDVNYTIKVTATLNGKTADSEFSFVVKAIPDTSKGVTLTADYLALGKYGNGTATIGEYEFEYVELGSYGDGIQMRKTSSLGNTVAFAKPIASIEFNYSETKSTYDNADVFKISFGNDATVASYSENLGTQVDVKKYTIVPDAATYTYFKMEKVVENYSYYWDSIVITFADETPKPVIYTPESIDVALGDITIALDATNKIVFASYTHDGYGGPGDGFYHDDTYVAVAGETHGIYALDAQWAGWPNKVTIDGEEVNAWTLFHVVVPENGKIVTGSVEAMLPIVNSLFGKEFTEMTGNAFFENELVDGAYNEKVVDMDSWTLVDPTVAAEKLTVTYTFADYEAGTQYAKDEAHVLDEYITVTTYDAHFTGELRLYSNANNDAYAIISSKSVIHGMTFNAGYNADNLDVYGSVDGVTFEKITSLAVAKAYSDVTYNIENSTYKYLKIDVAGTKQVRIKSMTLVYDK